MDIPARIASMAVTQPTAPELITTARSPASAVTLVMLESPQNHRIGSQASGASPVATSGTVRQAVHTATMLPRAGVEHGA